MILPAGEYPVKRVLITKCTCRLTERIGRRQKGGFHVDAYPALLGQVTDVLDEPVAHIDHRGGAEPGRLGPGRVVRLWPAVRGQQAGRPVQASLQQGQPGRGVPWCAGHGQHVPRPGTRAGDRRLAARSPRAVTASMITGAAEMSPPATAAPTREHSWASPAASSSAQAAGRSPGVASPTSRAVGTAPMAAMSARFWAAALPPISRADDQSRRKCQPSTRTSVLATTRPSGAASTAPSSPMPTSTPGVAGSRAASAAMRPNSPRSATVMGPSRLPSSL